MRKSLYWAGPRCFIATMRHFDLETIQILEKKYDWTVYYPPQVVSEAHKKNPNLTMIGKHGIIRRCCFEYVEKSDIIVAYSGLIWDSGTAREVEYAVSKNKPILAWSDSSVVFCETMGRNAVMNGTGIEKLYVKALPFNAMDIVFDRYLEVSELYNKGIDEQKLAEKIDMEAKDILKKNGSTNL